MSNDPQLLRLRNCAPLVLSLRKSDAVDSATNRIYFFLSTTENDSSLSRPRRATVRWKTSGLSQPTMAAFNSKV